MPPVFDNEVVTLPVPPVRDEYKVESVTFGIYQPDGSLYAELRCATTSSANPEIGEEPKRLRLYAGALQFLADFRAGPKASVKAWVQAQTDEAVPVPPEPEEE